MKQSNFEWDPGKEALNILKHDVDFTTAAQMFKDPNIRIAIDHKHSHQEARFFGIGKVNNRILTVRFIYRGGKIRIIGAGYWRKGVELYDQKNTQSN